MRRMITGKKALQIEKNAETLNKIGEKTAIYKVIADYGYSTRLAKFFNSVIGDIIAKGTKWYIGLEADDDPDEGYVPVIATFTLGDPEDDNQIPFEFLDEPFWLGDETCSQAPYVTINLTCVAPEGASTQADVQDYIDNGGVLVVDDESNVVSSIAIAYELPRSANVNVYSIDIAYEFGTENADISINHTVEIAVTDVDTVN